MLRLAPVVVFATALAPAQERMAWQVLRAAHIEGGVAVAAAEVRQALAGDPAVRRALARLDDAACLAVQDGLRDLLRGAGFAAADVQATVHDGELVVLVHEGPRRRCGEILVAGAKAVDAAVLRAAVTAADRRWPEWAQGRPAPAFAAVPAHVQVEVERVYHAHGRYGMRSTAEFRTHEDTVDLAIAVLDEGREVRAQRLEIQGDGADEARAALERIAWQPGTLLSEANLEALRSQLFASGRYTTVATDVPAQGALLDPFVVTVEPIADAPAFADPEAKVLARVQQGIDALLARLRAGATVRVDATLDEALPGEWVTLLPGRVRAEISMRRFFVHCDAVRFGPDAGEPVDLELVERGLEVQLGTRRFRWEVPTGIQAVLRSSVGQDGKTEVRWGIGFTTSGNLPNLVLDIAPPTALKLLRTAFTERHWDGENLVVTSGPTTFTLTANGALAADPIVLNEASPRVALTIDETQPPLPHDQADAGTLPQLLTTLLATRSGDATDAVGTALVQGILRALASTTPVPAAAERIHLAAAPGRRSVGSPIADLATFASAYAAGGQGPPWTQDLLGSIGAFVDGQRQLAWQHVVALAKHPDTGPLARAAIAAAFALAGNDQAAAATRGLARETWTFDRAYADLAPLLSNGPFQGSATALAAEWRKEPALADLMRPAQDDADALRIGLEHLWNRSLGDWLKAHLAFE